MSKIRQQTSPSERDVLVRTWPLRCHPGMRLEFFHEDWGQFVYANDGVMNVDTPSGTWVVPPHRAVWVPAGRRHTVRTKGTVSMRSIYLRRQEPLPNECQACSVSPLLKELVSHIAIKGVLLRTLAQDKLLHRLLVGLLAEAPVLPAFLPMPKISSLQGQALTGSSTKFVSMATGLSRRTLERRVRSETGMSLGTWRQQARLMHSLELLAAGEPVSEVAFQVGYGSPSAFIFAFRRHFGTSPGSFFDQ